MPVPRLTPRLKSAFSCKVAHEAFDAAFRFSGHLAHLRICYPLMLIKGWYKTVQECLFGRCQFFGNFIRQLRQVYSAIIRQLSGNFHVHIGDIAGKSNGSDSFKRYNCFEYIAFNQLRLITRIDFCVFIEIPYPGAEFVRAADVYEKPRDNRVFVKIAVCLPV